jgi:ribosome maturation factor RimP
VTLADGAALTGRVGETSDGAVQLVVRKGRDFEVRDIPLGDIAKAVVQVEFSTPNRRELELAGQWGKEAEQ